MKLYEGIQYNKEDDKFEFDFETNSTTSIIQFNELPLEPINIGIDDVYYFGYQFENNDLATSSIRKKFFDTLRFQDEFTSKYNKENFVKNALRKLHTAIGNIHKLDVIVYPESRSNLNMYITRIFYNVTNIRPFSYALIKKLPSEIEFDWKGFEEEVLNKARNKYGVLKYPVGHLRNNLINNVNKILDKIHQSEYFSIAESVPNNLYKKYFCDFFKYPADTDFETLKNAENILILDDVATTGASIFALIKATRLINPFARIIVFTLVGEKDIEEKF